MTRHETIRAILDEHPSLGDGSHDVELMDRLRERWSPPGKETDNTYALKHAVLGSRNPRGGLVCPRSDPSLASHAKGEA